ncbi:MAG: hypothetical protein AABX11_00235 [Nanoarchaeota archaeon]
MKKSGQLELSFSMIFSIIIIIATISVAFYFISKFMTTGKCTSLGIMKEDIQAEIDKVWASPFGVETYIGSPGSGIEKLCIGDLDKAGIKYSTIREDLDTYSSPGDNFYMYPPEKACQGSMAAGRLNHLMVGNFTCFDVKDGKVELKMSKENSSQTLVRIK